MRKKTVSRICAAVLGAAMVLSMTACGGSGTSDSTGSSSSSTEAGTGTSTGTSGGDSIVVSHPADPTTLAPNGQSGDGFTYAQIYDQLWNLTDGELVMRVGTGYQMIDDTHYEITIQSGIKDTAGNEITASDVLYSISLAKQGTAGYPGATRYIDVDNSVVVDDTTLDVALTQPCSYQMKALSMVNLVTQASYEASEDGMVTTPVGSGPYFLAEYVTGSYLKLEYNPDYWDGGDPEIKYVTVNFVSEASQRANVALTGECQFSNNISYTDADALEGQDNVTFSHKTSLNSTVLFFNNSSNSVFGGNVDLRKAVAYAINNETCIATAMGGYGEKSYCVTSKNFSDYSTDFEDISADTDYYAYDMDAAKEAFAASGVAEGTAITLIYGAAAGQDVIAQVIQANLQELGLTVNLECYPETQMQVLTNQPEDWDISINSWTNYPAQSGLATLNTFVGSGYLQMEGEQEESTLAAIEAVMSATSDEEVSEKMDELMQKLYDEVPVYGLFDEERLTAYDSNLNIVWKCQDYPLYNKWTWK